MKSLVTGCRPSRTGSPLLTHFDASRKKDSEHLSMLESLRADVLKAKQRRARKANSTESETK